MKTASGKHRAGRPSLAEYSEAPASPERREGGSGKSMRWQQGPLVTIVTVVRNGRSELPRTLDSVAAQGWEPLEHLVIDGASTDGTVDLLAADPRVDRWLSEPDAGIYDAMNKGIALARGELIGLLNAGDRYRPGAVAAAAAAYREHGEGSIYYGDQINEYGDLGLRTRLVAEPRKLAYRMSVCHESVFIPRAIFAARGLHDIRYSLAADFALLADEYLSGRRFVYLEQPVAVFETGGASTRGFVRYRRETLAFLRRAEGGRLLPAALVAGAEIALLELYTVFRPLVGDRLADALRRAWFRARPGASPEGQT